MDEKLSKICAALVFEIKTNLEVCEWGRNACQEKS